MIRNSTILSEYLKELRLTRKINVRGLAKTSGVGKSTLYDWESGKAQPRVAELDSVLAALQVTENQRGRAYSLMHAPRGRIGLVDPSGMTAPVPHRGHLIRSLRIRRGWTQQTAAQALGVTQSTLTRWETMQSFPPEAQLQHLCQVLGAQPEERNALHSLQLLAFDSGHPDIETCEAQIIDYRDHCDPALGDLWGLSLKRQIQVLHGKTPAGQRLLSMLNTQHAYRLRMENRIVESNKAAWEAIQNFESLKASEGFFASALNILSYSGPKVRRHRAKIRLLHHWLPRFPSGRTRMHLECDIAIHQSMIGGDDMALRLIESARSTLHSYNAESANDEEYFRLTLGRILTHYGQPCEGMALLPPIQVYDWHSMGLMLFWLEAFLAAGERDEATRLITTIDEILCQSPAPVVSKRLQILVKQLQG